MKQFLAGLVCVVLSGCAQIEQLASYSVSEAQLEQLLAEQLPKLTEKSDIAGIPVMLAVDKMKVNIGPDNSELVRINTAATATLSLFGLTYPATMDLVIEGAPYYDAQEQAVYVRSVKLLDSNIEAAGYRGNLAPVSNELLRVINTFLETNPVYKLDQNTDNTALKLLLAVPLNMSVQSGKIAFSPALN